MEREKSLEYGWLTLKQHTYTPVKKIFFGAAIQHFIRLMN